jgi:hypothetical protein
MKTIHPSERNPMLNTLALNVKTVTLVKRANLAQRCGNPIKSNYLMIRAIDLHVPQQTLNA